MTIEPTTDDLPVRRLRQYELSKLVGRGETSAVYQAREASLDRIVAIRLLHRDLAADSNQVWRFFSQSAAAARVQHPNIAQIYFVGQEDSHCFSVREYVQGISLGARLARPDHFSRSELLSIAHQILLGLAAAHTKGIVHGNLHAGNVLIDQANHRVVLSDFRGREANSGTPDRTGDTAEVGSESDDLQSVGRLMQQMWLSSEESGTVISSEGSRNADTANPAAPPAISTFMERLLGTGNTSKFESGAGALAAFEGLLEAAAPGRWMDIASVVDQAQISPTGFRPRVTAIIEVPVLEDLPELAEAIFALETSVSAGGWMQWFSDCFRRWSPEIRQRVSDTHAAVDGAIAEMQRRLSWLDQLQDEGQAILESLQNQAGQPAAKLNDDHAVDSGTALDSAVSEEQRQLEVINRRHAELAFTIQRLEAQRDLLNARLKVIEARCLRQPLNVPAAVSMGSMARTVIQITLVIALLSFAGYILYPSIMLSMKPATATRQVAVLSTSPPNIPVPKDTNAEFSWIPQDLTVVPLRTLSGYLNTETDNAAAYNSLSFCPGRAIVAAASADGTVRIWSLETGQEVQRFVYVWRNRPAAASAVEFRPDGRSLRFVGGFFERENVLVDLWNGRFRRENEVSTKPVVQFGKTSNGHPVIVGFGGPLVRLDPKSGQMVDPTPNEPREIRGAIYSPDKQFLAISEVNDNVTIWKIDSRQLLYELKGRGARTTGMAFSPDGRRFAAGVEDGSIAVWTLGSEGRATVLPSTSPNLRNAFPRSVAFSPDGQIVAGMGTSVTTLWDHARQKVVRYLITYSDNGQGWWERLAFSQDGRYLVTAGTLKGQPLVWDVSDLGRTIVSPSSSEVASSDHSTELGKTSQKHLAALRRLRYLQVTNQVGISDFGESLQTAMGGFVKANVNLGEEPVKWQEVTLNKAGAGFDAIRIPWPLAVRGDLYLCMATPDHVRVSSIARSSELYHPLAGQEVLNLNIPDLRVPDCNRFSIQRYDHGWMRPGEDHIIWFSLDTQDPVVVRFALTLRPTPADDPTKPPSDLSVEEMLGWKLPVQHTSVPLSVEREVHLPRIVDRFDFQPLLPFSKNRFPVVQARRYWEKER